MSLITQLIQIMGRSWDILGGIRIDGIPFTALIVAFFVISCMIRFVLAQVAPQ